MVGYSAFGANMSCTCPWGQKGRPATINDSILVVNSSELVMFHKNELIDYFRVWFILNFC